MGVQITRTSPDSSPSRLVYRLNLSSAPAPTSINSYTAETGFPGWSINYHTIPLKSKFNSTNFILTRRSRLDFNDLLTDVAGYVCHE